MPSHGLHMLVGALGSGLIKYGMSLLWDFATTLAYVTFGVRFATIRYIQRPKILGFDC